MMFKSLNQIQTIYNFCLPPFYTFWLSLFYLKSTIFSKIEFIMQWSYKCLLLIRCEIMSFFTIYSFICYIKLSLCCLKTWMSLTAVLLSSQIWLLHILYFINSFGSVEILFFYITSSYAQRKNLSTFIFKNFLGKKSSKFLLF